MRAQLGKNRRVVWPHTEKETRRVNVGSVSVHTASTVFKKVEIEDFLVFIRRLLIDFSETTEGLFGDY